MDQGAIILYLDSTEGGKEDRRMATEKRLQRVPEAIGKDAKTLSAPDKKTAASRRPFGLFRPLHSPRCIFLGTHANFFFVCA
jgi:hypothetical protein